MKNSTTEEERLNMMRFIWTDGDIVHINSKPKKKSSKSNSQSEKSQSSKSANK